MPSKIAKKVPVATAVRSKPKKRVTTPKKKKRLATPQYVELKIRVPIDDYQRGLPYFGARENMNKFVLDAYQERVNRAEANDKSSRQRKLITDMGLLLPILREMSDQGKLNFLKDK